MGESFVFTGGEQIFDLVWLFALWLAGLSAAVWAYRCLRLLRAQRRTREKVTAAFELVVVNCRDEWPGLVMDWDHVWATPTCFIWRMDFNGAYSDPTEQRVYIDREMARVVAGTGVLVVGMELHDAT